MSNERRPGIEKDIAEIRARMPKASREEVHALAKQQWHKRQPVPPPARDPNGPSGLGEIHCYIFLPSVKAPT